ncbi:unnamed protein product [Arabidopsis thaliana]|uniref:(thale cress) hypothetical protein n=1 Tax=Arabidopsis thaliana TaxID=3702 RepID=A0A7G2DVX4_ARATH|nr:unnamed protein product [Arabidopsis thaliana]
MFSLSEFVFRIYDHISESCVGGDTTSYDKEIKYRQAAYAEIDDNVSGTCMRGKVVISDQAFVYAQSVYVEDGDNDDDDIYDYAPAA